MMGWNASNWIYTTLTFTVYYFLASISFFDFVVVSVFVELASDISAFFLDRKLARPPDFFFVPLL